MPMGFHCVTKKATCMHAHSCTYYIPMMGSLEVGTIVDEEDNDDEVIDNENVTNLV